MGLQPDIKWSFFEGTAYRAYEMLGAHPKDGGVFLRFGRRTQSKCMWLEIGTVGMNRPMRSKMWMALVCGLALWRMPKSDRPISLPFAQKREMSFTRLIRMLSVKKHRLRPHPSSHEADMNGVTKNGCVHERLLMIAMRQLPFMSCTWALGEDPMGICQAIVRLRQNLLSTSRPAALPMWSSCH